MRVPIIDRRSRAAEADGTPGCGARAEARDPGETAAPDPVGTPPTATAAPEEDWRERCLRTAADLENLRRVFPARVEEELFRRERDFLERWLALGDALDRAGEQTGAAAPEWSQGLAAVVHLFGELMERGGVRRIPPVERFDPAIHEAVAVVPDPDRPDGTIVETTRAGWLLHDRLLRPASVVVVRNG